MGLGRRFLTAEALRSRRERGGRQCGTVEDAWGRGAAGGRAAEGVGLRGFSRSGEASV